jgi:hypothetical protein
MSDEKKVEPQIVSPDDSVDHLISQLFVPTEKGKYKVELFCETKRSIWKPFSGIITVWKSGAAFSGSGDAGIYFCPRCHSIITPDSHGEYTTYNGKHVAPFYGACCHECGVIFMGEQLEDSRFARLSASDWVDLLIKYFYELGRDVDYYLKFNKTEIRPVVHDYKMQPTLQYSRKVHKQLVDKDIVIYPLSRLMEDMHSGRSLKSALMAFLTA